MGRTAVLLVCVLAGCVSVARGGAEPHAARIEAASQAHAAALSAYDMGTAPLSDTCAWSVRWYQAMHQAGDASAATAHQARMEALSTAVEKRVASGSAPAREVVEMQYFVAEAKVWQMTP